ncbi:MAG: nickel pincer cofactor biosynthesis protein LarC [Phycisphaerae bacterium]
MKTAYFDCFSGAAGDMIVGSLIDAGAPADALFDALRTLPVSGYELKAEPVKRMGISGTHFQVHLDEAESQPHRHLHHIVEIINNASFSESVKNSAIEIFTRLAEAEAAVHGSTIEKVHFHEVGAVDAIVDIVGACLAFDMLGIERVVCSPIPPGNGTVRCAHGVMPVPAPATANLLRDIPLRAAPNKGELTTPTGAAILTAWASVFGDMPSMTVGQIGYGSGTREGDVTPNLLRVLIGESTADGAPTQVTVLETNLDDATPEVISYAMQRVLDAGALDVYAVPIHMKKSRPATMLCAIARNEDAERVRHLLFQETPTFGVRSWVADRTVMAREWSEVETRFGTIRMKVGRVGESRTVSPEFEDCRAAAERHGVALREVQSAAVEAYGQRKSAK